MTSLNEPQILKSDTRGRVRTPPERRTALLDEFERSGVSMAEFARLSGVKYQTLAVWVLKRRRERARSGEAAVAPGAPVRLWEAVIEPEAGVRLGASAGLTIDLPGGAQLTLERAGQLPLAVALLEQLGQHRRRTC